MSRRKLAVPAPKLVKHKGFWQVSYTHPSKGVTYRRSTGTKDRLIAEKRMHAIVTELLTTPAPRDAAYELGDLLVAYEKQRAGKVDATHYALKPLKAFFDGFKLSKLNDAAWLQYRKWRTAQSNVNAAALASKEAPAPISDATACKELNVLRAALSWARRNGWKGLESVKVHLPNEPHNVSGEYLSHSEATQLVRACVEPHQKLYVLLALATGARMSALLELQWDDVGAALHIPDTEALIPINIIDAPDLHYKNPKTGEEFFLEGYDFDLEMKQPLRINLGQGRGNKRRGTGVIGKENIALYDALVAAYKRRQTPYVIEYRGKKIATIDLSKAYRRAKLFGFTRRQHLLKHTCCSWLVEGGASYEAVAKLVGTKSNVIEKHYGHLSPQHFATIGNFLTVRI